MNDKSVLLISATNVTFQATGELKTIIWYAYKVKQADGTEKVVGPLRSYLDGHLALKLQPKIFMTVIATFKEYVNKDGLLVSTIDTLKM